MEKELIRINQSFEENKEKNQDFFEKVNRELFSSLPYKTQCVIWYAHIKNMSVEDISKYVELSQKRVLQEYLIGFLRLRKMME